MVMLRRGVSANSCWHTPFLFLFFTFILVFFCLLFCFLSLFVLHGVFIYCFAIYIKTPKNSKVRPSSHKTPSSIPKKTSSSRSPSVSSTSSGPKESRPRVSTSAGVRTPCPVASVESALTLLLFYWPSVHCCYD